MLNMGVCNNGIITHRLMCNNARGFIIVLNMGGLLLTGRLIV